MNLPEFAVEERLLSAAERAAFGVFERLVSPAPGQALAESAVEFADILGSPGEFARYAKGREADRLASIDRLLKVFRENAELLVHKTWVEKSDEKRKERLLEEITHFEREFREGAVGPAFRHFVALCRSVAHLLFGAQSRADDFLLYCFRIDPKLGLFFWYVEELEEQARAGLVGEELMTMETLIGMYLLASF